MKYRDNKGSLLGYHIHYVIDVGKARNVLNAFVTPFKPGERWLYRGTGADAVGYKGDILTLCPASDRGGAAQINESEVRGSTLENVRGYLRWTRNRTEGAAESAAQPS
jgi:hypothetical protein